MSDSTGETHSYKKSMYGDGASVTIDAGAESIDQLKLMLQKVGITLPSGGPEAQEEPCDSEEMPLDAIVVSQPEEEPQGMQFPRTEIDPDAQHDASMTTDKEVLSSIIRDRLKDYLRNSK
jgi:hypothetical protein